jgi:hypothetical protein
MATINKKIMDILDGLELVYDIRESNSFIKDSSTYKGRSGYRRIGDTDTNGFFAAHIFNELGVFIKTADEKEINKILRQQAIKYGVQDYVYKRYAHIDNVIYINLCNGWVLRIDGKSIEKVTNTTANFIEHKNFSPIKNANTKYGDINLLRKHINVSDDEFKLIVVFMVNAIFHNAPQLILIITGVPGSSKSTMQAMIKEIVDPSIIVNQNQPHDVRDLIVSAANSYLLNFNNVTDLDTKIQNAFCTISTGGVAANRALNTNSDQHILNTKNPVIINGIVNPATREDMLQRSIIVNLPPIYDEQRKDEIEIKADFEQDLSKIRGGLYNIVKGVLAINESFIRPSTLNRMADFTLLGYKVEEVLQWEKGSFKAAYDLNLSISEHNLLERSEVSQSLIEYCQHSDFKGTLAELLGEMNHFSTHQINGFSVHQMTPRKLGAEIDKIANALFALHGIKVERLPRSGGKNLVSISRTKLLEPNHDNP